MNKKNNNLSSKCIVLVPLERIDAAHHIAQRFEFDATFEHHPGLAMAEICLLHQQANSVQAWNADVSELHLILIHATELTGVQPMIDSVRRYLPHVIVSELRDGRIEQIENHGAIVDALEEPPMIQSESIDADELSMLLDETPQEVDE
jgi:hypothetical protein